MGTHSSFILPPSSFPQTPFAPTLLRPMNTAVRTEDVVDLRSSAAARRPLWRVLCRASPDVGEDRRLPRSSAGSSPRSTRKSTSTTSPASPRSSPRTWSTTSSSRPWNSARRPASANRSCNARHERREHVSISRPTGTCTRQGVLIAAGVGALRAPEPLPQASQRVGNGLSLFCRSRLGRFRGNRQC